MALTARSAVLAKALKTFRTDVAGLSRKEIAERAGISESTLQKIEDGRSPNPGIFTVAAIAVALDLDVTDLLRRRTGPLPLQRLSRTSASGSEDDS